MSLERHRPWLVTLAVVLLALGIYSFARTARSRHCIRMKPAIFLASLMVFAVVAFPEWVAGFLVEYLR